jgi:ABC-type branched-subunit amino acid transport system substrate-binding protein
VNTKVRRHRWRAALAVCSLVGILSACSLQKQYGVPTHTVPVKGNCNTSRIEEIGAALPLSGTNGELGREYLDGIRLAVAQTNNTQGVTQKHACFELLYKDIGNNVHIGDRGVLDLVNSEVVQFLIAPFQSSVIQFTGSDLGLSGVPNTTASSLNAPHSQRNNYPYTFPTEASAEQQGLALASYAAKQNWRSVAVVKLGDPSGSEMFSSFKSAFENKGGNVVATATISTTKRFTASSLAPLRSAKPDALVVMGDTTQIGQALVARQQLAWTVPALSTENGADGSVVSQLTAAGKNGVAVLVPNRVVLPNSSGGASKAFRNQVARYLGVSTLPGSIIPYAEGYDGVMMMASAANSINNTSPGNIQTYLENANYQGILAAYNYTSSFHSGLKASDLQVAQLDWLNNGLFQSPPKTRTTAKL